MLKERERELNSTFSAFLNWRILNKIQGKNINKKKKKNII
jgi:hypothetical protein